MITDIDTSKVIEKSKMRRERSCVRKTLQCSHESVLHTLFFDGCKDQTLAVENIDSKYFHRSKKEDHYSLTEEPGSIYIGDVSAGTSSDIAASIISLMIENEISLGELDVVGCDGTVINTGWMSGVICQIELHVGRPVQWEVCPLHFNELPFLSTH